MFSRAFAATVVMIATLTTSVMSAPASGSQCNTGDIQCCNSMQSASNPGVATLLGLLGLVLDPNTNVGVTCSPITVIGVSGTNCASQPVCCENNNFNGLVALGCTPINISL
ncbi:hydrophobin-251 [Desarmillaria ectypa]|nr:hydrophobin-251 [Desarmillaria ectypa]